MEHYVRFEWPAKKMRPLQQVFIVDALLGNLSGYNVYTCPKGFDCIHQVNVPHLIKLGMRVSCLKIDRRRW